MSTKKQNYIAPQVERIELDNEIALQLESTLYKPGSFIKGFSKDGYHNGFFAWVHISSDGIVNL